MYKIANGLKAQKETSLCLSDTARCFVFEGIPVTFVTLRYSCNSRACPLAPCPSDGKELAGDDSRSPRGPSYVHGRMPSGPFLSYPYSFFFFFFRFLQFQIKFLPWCRNTNKSLPSQVDSVEGQTPLRTNWAGWGLDERGKPPTGAGLHGLNPRPK